MSSATASLLRLREMNGTPPTWEQFQFIAQTWKRHKAEDIAHAHLKDAIRYGLWLEAALEAIFDQLMADAVREGHDPADAHEDIRESHPALMDVVNRKLHERS